jgi:hypothetical protein
LGTTGPTNSLINTGPSIIRAKIEVLTKDVAITYKNFFLFFFTIYENDEDISRRKKNAFFFTHTQ